MPAGLWGKAEQRSLDRSALVDALEQLTRAFAQIAAFATALGDFLHPIGDGAHHDCRGSTPAAPRARAAAIPAADPRGQASARRRGAPPEGFCRPSQPLRRAFMALSRRLSLSSGDLTPRGAGRGRPVLERMVLELRGVACLGLEEVTPDRKSLVASRSFGRPVETRRELEEAVSVYAARAAEKMRRQNLATASLALWVQTNSFKPDELQYSASKAVRLPVATAETGKLIAAATAGLGIIFKPGYRYKKAGVTFLDLVSADRGRPVRPSGRCALDPSHARARSAQRALRPRHGRLRHRRRAAWLGIAAGIHIAALHDGMERTAASVGRHRSRVAKVGNYGFKIDKCALVVHLAGTRASPKGTCDPALLFAGSRPFRSALGSRDPPST